MVEFKQYFEDGKFQAASFRDDVLKEVGLKRHPKAEEAFQIAWIWTNADIRLRGTNLERSGMLQSEITKFLNESKESVKERETAVWDAQNERTLRDVHQLLSQLASLLKE